MISFILLAGGAGTRMNQPVPKQFLLLCGKPIIIHTIERIERIEEISEIVLVCNDIYRPLMEDYRERYLIKKPIKYAHAGISRQESMYNAIVVASFENLVIHEAARPFVTQTEFEMMIKNPNANAIYGYRIPYTVVIGGNQITNILNREELVNVQLPQKFQRSRLLAVHKRARMEGKHFTEDASMMFYYDKLPIEILTGSPYNIKITESIDLLIAETIYKDYIIKREQE
jgi:2-C-methyl-D-erythritol 4-phosphate cytidylyltransferase